MAGPHSKVLLLGLCGPQTGICPSLCMNSQPYQAKLWQELGNILRWLGTCSCVFPSGRDQIQREIERGKIRRALGLHTTWFLFCLRSARPTRVLMKHWRVWIWKPRPKICQLHMLPTPHCPDPRIYGPGLVLLVAVVSQFLNKKSHTPRLVGKMTETVMCVAMESHSSGLCLHMLHSIRGSGCPL